MKGLKEGLDGGLEAVKKYGNKLVALGEMALLVLSPACAEVQSSTRQDLARLDALGREPTGLQGVTDVDLHLYLQTLTHENLRDRDADDNCLGDLIDAIVARAGGKINNFGDLFTILKMGVDEGIFDPIEVAVAIEVMGQCFRSRGDKEAQEFFEVVEAALEVRAKKAPGENLNAKESLFIELTLDNVDEVLASKKPTIIDIWADWCAPCHKQSRILAELMKKYPGVFNVARFEFVDGEEEIQAKMLHKLGGIEIEAFPTIVIKDDGKYSILRGLQPLEELEAALMEF